MAAHSAERKQVLRMVAKMRQLAKGFQNNGQLVATFQMGGQMLTPVQVLARLQPSLDAASQVDALKTQLKGALATRDAGVLADEPYLRQLSLSLYSNLGGSNPKLGLFGVPYDKPRKKRTSAEEAVSVALRLQTRKVRGTMGPKQRAAITTAGTPGLLVVDPTGKPIPGAGRAPVAPGKKPVK